jgi:aldehyde dehydrogenase (NAD+)
MATALNEQPTETTPAAYQNFDRIFVDGEWREGRAGESSEDRDPYTGEILVRIRHADERDLGIAFDAAASAQPRWHDMLPAERAAVFLRAALIMEQRYEEIVDWLVRESGSTRIKADIEWEMTQAVMLESASFPSRVEGPILPSDIPDKENRVYRQPVGVVGMISPWNFPLHLSNRSIAPALALGNAAVIKPASDTPITGGLLLAKIYEEAGLPDGVLNVIVGPGRELGDAFIQHPVPRAITFTGSTEVGRHIAELASQSSIMKRVALELGGNSPLVILDDADLYFATNIAIFGKFLHQGQICMAINRIIVDERVHDEFVERFTNRARKLKIGNPNDHDTVIGPLINDEQLHRSLEHIKKARDEGAKQVLGGEPQGLVLPPQVFVDVRNDMSVAQEEMFGPIVSVIKVRDEEEALQVANETSYGLSSAVVTRDLERGNQFAKQMQAGMSHVNDSPVNDMANCPFGGEKNSGLGRFNGQWAIEEFTTVHWVSVQQEPIDYPF